MQVDGAFEKAKQYIQTHTFTSTVKKSGEPCITISRETGSGADRVGDELIKFFHSFGKEFIIFDKNLIDKILQDHDLPEKLKQYLEEEKHSPIKSIMNEVLGIHPPTEVLLRKISETIIKLAEMGNAIIVGRGANIITSKMKNTFHVRLIAPIDLRIKNMMTYYHMDLKEATEFVKKEDEKRRKYIQTHFYKEINDPTLYHLVINTQLLSNEEIAKLIGNAVVIKFPKLFDIKKI
jgi:hypothetical protein